MSLSKNKFFGTAAGMFISISLLLSMSFVCSVADTVKTTIEISPDGQTSITTSSSNPMDDVDTGLSSYDNFESPLSQYMPIILSAVAVIVCVSLIAFILYSKEKDKLDIERARLKRKQGRLKKKSTKVKSHKNISMAQKNKASAHKEPIKQNINDKYNLDVD